MTPGSAPAGRLQIDLSRVARAAWARRRALLAFHGVVLLVAVATALLLPRTYVSSVTLVPAPQDGLNLDFTGLAGLRGPSLSLSGPTPQDQLKLVVTSRAVADTLVNRFDLVERWALRRRDQARERLAERTVVTTPRSGELRVAIEAETPAFARDLAAAYADVTADESVRLKTSLATQRREYLEARLADLESEIRDAARNVRTFEETHGAVSLPDQARETMDAAGTLQAQVALLETELAAARRYFTERAPEVVLLRERAAELRRQGERLARHGGTLLLRGEALPALKQEYVTLTRQQASLTAVSEVLRRVYEQARVEEANPVAAFSVLDAAQLPERHAWPKRGLIVLLSLALAASGAFAWLVWREQVERSRGREAAASSGSPDADTPALEEAA